MKRLKSIAAIALCLIVLSPLASSKASELKWQAQWIWEKDTLTANTWVAMRKEVVLDSSAIKVKEPTLAYISADTKYWLWINGELVVFEGSYTGGPTPVTPAPRQDFFPIASNRYYDRVDISKYLKKGKNTIAALVWYYGANGEKGTNISSGSGGFLFQAQAGNTLIATDKSWKLKRHPAYIQHLDKKKPYRVAAWNVKYDAQKDLKDWSDSAWYMPGFNDESWKTPHRPRAVSRPPFYDLYPSEIPILNNYGLANCINFPESAFPFVSDGKKIQCKLDINKNFTPYFDIEAEAGLPVHIDSNMKRNTIETFYTTKAGRQQFESLSWLNGRIIEYTFPKGVTVHGLKYRWTGVGKTPGHFESSDEWYTRIWQMAENTLYICARDNFMDTPDRERGLWIGDVADQASYLFYSMDKPGRDLLKKSIKITMAFSDSQTGIFAGLGPGRFRELPAQSLQFIDQGVWHYYYNTGDIETLEYAYPYVHKYLTLWGIKENGLATFRDGHWRWTDWGPQETIDYDVIQNTLYYSALVAARKMAKALGDNTHMSFYNGRIASIQKSFQEQYWHNGFFSSDTAKFKDDRANAIAILYGLAKPSQYKQIVDNVLVPNHFASPHFEWMVYNAMAIADRHEDALARMKARYSAQVDNPELSTLAEYLPAAGTENHAWNAPSTILSKYIAGIEPTAVAWSHYRIMPNMAHMTRVKQIVPSVKGRILFEITRNKELVDITLSSPKNTSAVIGIPKQYFDIASVTFNRKKVWQKNRKTSSIKGITYIGEDDKYLKFEVAPGKWSIRAEK